MKPDPCMTMKKLRADSTFARLSEEDLAQVDDMLLSGSSYEEERAFMAECGQTCSQTSVADYYHTHILPRKWARQQRIARFAVGVDGWVFLARWKAPPHALPDAL